MWYNFFSECLLKEMHVNNTIYPCIFIKKSKLEFAITVVYVDYLNLVGTFKELTRIIIIWKKNLRWKILEKQNFGSACKSSIFQMEF